MDKTLYGGGLEPMTNWIPGVYMKIMISNTSITTAYMVTCKMFIKLSYVYRI